MILLNSINTNSAGTSNVTKNILKDMTLDGYEVIVEDNVFFSDVGTSSASLIKINFGTGVDRLCRRFAFLFWGIKKMVKDRHYDKVVIMANYSPFKFPCKKIVIMRHPYLVDHRARSEIKTFKNHLIEYVRLILFRVTLLSTDVLVVQTEAMKTMFVERYPWFRGEVRSISNPVPKSILDFRTRNDICKSEVKSILFYPSRYYSHKNHEFLVGFADRNREALRKKGLKFVITLAQEGEGKHILQKISELKIDDLVLNVAEVRQENLYEYYLNSFCLFFPSKAETFGNSLAEAMCFGLPILALDRPYSRSLCGEAALYFREADTSVLNCIERLAGDWGNYSSSVKAKSMDLMDANDWLNQISS